MGQRDRAFTLRRTKAALIYLCDANAGGQLINSVAHTASAKKSHSRTYHEFPEENIA
jgi:hypothetical protein